MPDYRFRWNGYKHPALIAAFTGVRTPGGLIKNMTGNATYDGTLNGTYTPANPLIRAKNTPSLDFDGAAGAGGNYISLANPITSLSAFTIIAWLNMDTWNGMLFSRAAAAGTYFRLYTPGVTDQNVSGTYYVGKRGRNLNTTVMLALTKDSSNNGVTYIDGKLDLKGALGAAPADANAFLGQYWDASLRFNGRMDNVMFWSQALTQEQIQSIRRSAEPRA